MVESTAIIESISTNTTQNNTEQPKPKLVTDETTAALRKEEIDLLREFLLTKKIEGCSMTTIKGYSELLLKFIIWALPTDVRELSAKDIREYLYEYQEVRGVTNSTLDHMRLTISSFYRFLEEEDYILKNPCRKIHRIRSEEVVRKPFTDEELERIRRGTDNIRDLAIVDLLYSSGMRISELIGIDIRDVNFKEREIIVAGKGNRERICYFNARTKLEILEYLGKRMDYDPALFVSRREPVKRVTRGGVQKMLKKLQKETGVENIHPHRFRRTLATNLLNKGMTLEQVQIVLGHKRIETTLIYTAINKDQVKQGHQKFTY